MELVLKKGKKMLKENIKKIEWNYYVSFPFLMKIPFFPNIFVGFAFYVSPISKKIIMRRLWIVMRRDSY